MLMIIIDLIKNFMPRRQSTRHVLMITRFREAHKKRAITGNSIELVDMIKDEVTQLYLKEFSGEDQQTAEANELADLVEILGFLPLAIIQAAAYIRECQGTILKYIKSYKLARERLSKWKPLEESDFLSVATVMALSFKKIKSREESVRLFCLISCFGPDNIPESLLVASPIIKDEMLLDVFSNEESLNRAFAPLCAYCFVKRFEAKKSFSVHRVVQNVMKDIIELRIKDEGRVLESIDSSEAKPTYWLERGIETLVSAYPDSDNPDSWNVCETINRHAFVCIEYCERYGVATYETCSLYSSIGIYEGHHGSYKSAESLFMKSLLRAEQIFGEDHINTADTINNLGLTYDSQGKYDEAIAHYERSLRIFEKAFGVDHINTASTINNLGLTYDSQGKNGRALCSYER